MGAYQIKYLQLRLRGLSHAAAFTLVQSLLGPLSPAQRETLLAWALAHEERIAPPQKKQMATASPIS